MKKAAHLLKLTLAFTMFLNISAFATNTKLILTTSDPHQIEIVKKYFNIVEESGRLTFLSYKKGISKNMIPAKVRKFFRPVAIHEIKQINHKNLMNQLRFRPKQDQDILRLLGEVSLENIYEITKKVSQQENRRSGAPGNQWTTAYIENEFKKYNLEVEKDCFSPGLCNVIGIQKGNFDQYVVVEAHLDSVGKKFAGADDNASGIAGLLEIMRIASTLNGDKGIIFFATNGEESGLLGSKTFVANAKKTGLINKLSFVINMDMIAYNKNGQVDIETDKKFEDVAKWYATIFATYTTLKTNISMPAWGSDHVPFLRAGIPGVLTIEHWSTRNPCYHKACDTLDNLNFNYTTEIVKANLAALLIKISIQENE